VLLYHVFALQKANQSHNFNGCPLPAECRSVIFNALTCTAKEKARKTVFSEKKGHHFESNEVDLTQFLPSRSSQIITTKFHANPIPIGNSSKTGARLSSGVDTIGAHACQAMIKRNKYQGETHRHMAGVLSALICYSINGGALSPTLTKQAYRALPTILYIVTYSRRRGQHADLHSLNRTYP